MYISQNELAEAEVEREKRQHSSHPGQKLDRLTGIYIEKGVSPNLAEAVARQISADPAVAVATHLRGDLGIDPDDLPSPRTAALASFAAAFLATGMAFVIGHLVGSHLT